MRQSASAREAQRRQRNMRWRGRSPWLETDAPLRLRRAQLHVAPQGTEPRMRRHRMPMIKGTAESQVLLLLTNIHSNLTSLRNRLPSPQPSFHRYPAR